ncbi:phospholipid/cholesterol/gamma-HCH transport system permease protein [Nocardioides sp. J9]|nr:ABC transporter permease [Nocardioides sp. J9]TWH02699.1 phospholipid/cholesterol/gamma-HCH transport system permease protein [Nocardioides sp. J9]
MSAAARTAVLTRPLVPVGELLVFALEVLRGLFRRPFAWRELSDQAWFATRVSLLPACAITIPFGAVLALQIGSLFDQLGARSFTGAVAVVGIVQQAAPIATVVIVAGAAGTAVAADLGSRKIREELDALEVLGLNVIDRLVVPRVLAMGVVAALLNAIATSVGIIGAYAFNVLVQGGSPGAYLASFSALAQLPDLYVGELKAFLFGILAGIVATYQGVRAKGGARGVGDGVNQSVVIAFVVLFLANALLTALYYELVPPKGL